MLYEKISDEVDYPYFLTKYKMSNTFASWFIIMEIHLYMLMVRSMAEENDPIFIRNSIVEEMYRDCAQRVKKLSTGQSSTLIREQLHDLVDQFKYSLIAYDEGMNDDKKLASAIWCRVFNRESDKYDEVEELVKYMRENVSLTLKIDEKILLF